MKPARRGLRDEAAASRAVTCCNIWSTAYDAPEPLLALNKVMCGMPIATPSSARSKQPTSNSRPATAAALDPR